MSTDKEKLAQRTADVIRAYQTVFTSADGQLVLYDILSQGFVFAPTASASSHECAVAEGRRGMALMIMNMTNKDVKTITNQFIGQKDNEAKYHASLTGGEG